MCNTSPDKIGVILFVALRVKINAALKRIHSEIFKLFLASPQSRNTCLLVWLALMPLLTKLTLSVLTASVLEKLLAANIQTVEDLLFTKKRLRIDEILSDKQVCIYSAQELSIN